MISTTIYNSLYYQVYIYNIQRPIYIKKDGTKNVFLVKFCSSYGKIIYI